MSDPSDLIARLEKASKKLHQNVRERCRAEELENNLDGVRYSADDVFGPIANSVVASEAWGKLFHYGFKGAGRPSGRIGRTVPSIHMPRWASRLTLIVTEVRIQRLHAITEDDAIAEGIKELGPYCWSSGESRSAASAPDAFAELWQSLHGLHSWHANPWVWALSFTVEKKNIDA